MTPTIETLSATLDQIITDLREASVIIGLLRAQTTTIKRQLTKLSKGTK